MSASTHDLAHSREPTEPQRGSGGDTPLAAIALRKVSPPPGGLIEKVRSHGHSAADDDELDFDEPFIDSALPLVDTLIDSPTPERSANSPPPIGRRTDWSGQLRDPTEKVAQRRTLLWFLLFLCVAGLAAVQFYWQ